VCAQVAPLLREQVAIAALAVVVLLAFASTHHARTFRTQTEDQALDSIPALADFYKVYPDGDWSVIGNALRRELAAADALVALDAVGGSLYSGLRTVDQLGLNDAFVAAHGLRRRIASRNHASLPYLRRHHRPPSLVPLISVTGNDPQWHEWPTTGSIATPLNRADRPRPAQCCCRCGQGRLMCLTRLPRSTQPSSAAGPWGPLPGR
jgi:hypothetical protein